MNFPKTLCLLISFLILSCSIDTDKPNEFISGEEMFRSIVLMDGEHVSKIGTYKDVLPFIKPLSTEQEERRESFNNDIIQKIKIKYPTFFEEFQRDISSGNPYMVAEACERAFEYSHSAFLELFDEEGLTGVINSVSVFDYTQFDLNDPEVRQDIMDSLLVVVAANENEGSTDQFVTDRCITVILLVAASIAVTVGAIATFMAVYEAVMVETEGLAYSNTAVYTTTSVYSGGGGGCLTDRDALEDDVYPQRAGGERLIYEITLAFQE